MSEMPYLLNIIPAVVIAILAFLFFKIFFDNEEKRRRVMLMEGLKKQTTNMRFQAYERIVVLLERIHPPRLIARTSDKNLTKEIYASQLIRTIEKEYDYNISQQLYVTAECWKMIEIAKQSIIRAIQMTVADAGVTNCEDFKALLLKNIEEGELPTRRALNYTKSEAKKLW